MWETAAASRSSAGTPRNDEEDPFRDPVPESSSRQAAGAGGRRTSDDAPALNYQSYEPYHYQEFGSSNIGAKPDPVTPVSDDGARNENYAYRGTPPPKGKPEVYRY
jgi:hypothetical protein